MNDWHKLLRATNRTAALAIDSLDEPLKHSVTCGLLILQALHDLVAIDTPSTLERRRLLVNFASLAADPSRQAAERVVARASRVSDEIIQQGPLRHLPELASDVESLDAASSEIVWRYAARASERALAYAMRARADGHVVIRDEEELAGYCHLRGGIAAELTTDLLIVSEPSLADVAAILHEIAPGFAQGIRLVDLLDSEDGNACPICVREPLERSTIVSMSEHGMQRAEDYLDVLRAAGARPQILAFVSLPLVAAKARLHRMRALEDTLPAGEPSRGSRRASGAP